MNHGSISQALCNRVQGLCPPLTGIWRFASQTRGSPSFVYSPVQSYWVWSFHPEWAHCWLLCIPFAQNSPPPCPLFFFNDVAIAAHFTQTHYLWVLVPLDLVFSEVSKSDYWNFVLFCVFCVELVIRFLFKCALWTSEFAVLAACFA